MHRRHFLHTGALTLGALCTPLLGVIQAAAPARGMALAFIGKYSDHFLLRNDTVAGATRMVALVQDLPRFAEALFRAKAAGISGLRVAGTVVTFRAGGQLFEVDNLMQHDFTARLAEHAGNLIAVTA
jgi:hypothetical protein